MIRPGEGSIPLQEKSLEEEFKMAIEVFGKEKQIDKSIIAMTALVNELLKNREDINNLENIKENLVDVWVKLDEIKEIYNINLKELKAIRRCKTKEIEDSVYEEIL
ncbi:MAG: hypothetical protein ACOCRK_02165 [bacterium]